MIPRLPLHPAQMLSCPLPWLSHGKTRKSPALAQAYRGQDLILQWYPGWQGALPSPLLPWLTYRQAPLAQLQVVLWARVDIFPGGTLEMLELTPDEAGRVCSR